MTDSEIKDLTIEILLEIRNEIRSMRATFEARFEALETRMGAIEGRM